jgi:hypothetical protein
MVYFELKKILSRTGNKVALGILGLVLILVCYFSLQSQCYIDEQGNTIQGIAAVKNLKAFREEWSGTLTIEKIQKVIEENNRINQTEEAKSEELQEQEIAYGWKQGFSDIRHLLAVSYGKFREYDSMLPDRLKPEDAGRFYENRVNQLKEWLDTEGKDLYSEQEKAFLIRSYETLETPLEYEFYNGWQQIRDYFPTIIMVTVLVLGYLLSGIFARESQLKADAIFYSTRFGRDRAIYAKLKAGLICTTVLYFAMTLSFSLVLWGLIGFDGAFCPIQISGGGWKSLYHINFLEEYVIMLTGGYLGTLFFAFLTMFVSAKTRSAVISVSIPFILIFLPSFLLDLPWPQMSKILGLFPDQLLQLRNAMGVFNLYEIGGKVLTALPLLGAFYLPVTWILYPVIYRVYKKAEVK